MMDSPVPRLFDGDFVDLTSEPETETQEVSDDEDVVFVDRMFCVDKSTTVDNANVQNKLMVTKEVNANALQGSNQNKKIVTCKNVNLAAGILNLGAHQFVLDETLKKALLKGANIALVVNQPANGEKNKVSNQGQETSPVPALNRLVNQQEQNVVTVPSISRKQNDNNKKLVAKIVNKQIVNQHSSQNTNDIEETIVAVSDGHISEDDEVIMLPHQSNDRPPVNTTLPPPPLAVRASQAPRFFIHSVTTAVSGETATATHNLRKEMDKSGVLSMPHLPALANHNIYKFLSQATQNNVKHVTILQAPPGAANQSARVISNVELANIGAQAEKGLVKILTPLPKTFTPQPSTNTPKNKTSPFKGFQVVDSPPVNNQEVLGKESNKIQDVSNVPSKDFNMSRLNVGDATKVIKATARNHLQRVLANKVPQKIDKNQVAESNVTTIPPDVSVARNPPPLAPRVREKPPKLTPFDGNDIVLPGEERPLPRLIPFDGNENLINKSQSLTVINDIKGKPVYFLIHSEANLENTSVGSLPTPEVELHQPPLVTPVDITKILEEGKKSNAKSRCSCGELRNKQLYRKGFTKVEQKRPACLKELQKIVKTEQEKLKIMRKKMDSYNSNVVYCGRTLANLLPENIKCETDEEFDDCIDLCNEDDDDDYESLPTIANVISKVNEELLQLKESHQRKTITRKQGKDLKVKLSKPNEALELIKKGLELIQNWSAESTEKKIQEVLPTQKKTRKRKSDPGVPKQKEDVVSPKRRRKTQEPKPSEKPTKERKTSKNAKIKEAKMTEKAVKEKPKKERPQIKIKLAGETKRKKRATKKTEPGSESNLSNDDLLVVKRVDILKNNKVISKRKKISTAM